MSIEDSPKEEQSPEAEPVVEAEQEPTSFVAEMQALRAGRAAKIDSEPSSQSIRKTRSIPRLVRRVRIAVKRLIRKKLRKQIRQFTS